LIVTCEPDSGLPSPAPALTWPYGRVTVLPPPGYAGSLEPGDDPDAPVEWHITPDIAVCVRKVTDLVRKHHQTLRIVDIERPGSYREQVLEFMLGSHSFPILVRPDGRRLEGIEEFKESTIESFLMGR